MDPSYPQDYHPLSPLIRRLRGSIAWHLNAGHTLSSVHFERLMHMTSTLPKSPSNEDRVLKIARYWESVPHTSVDEIQESTLVQEVLTQSQVTQRGPLPASSFPAVTHTRHLVDSISFEKPPPSGPQVEGSAELMTPSVMLKAHRGELKEVNPVPVDLENKGDHAAGQVDEISSSLHPEGGGEEVSKSTETSLSDQLWARRPAPETKGEEATKERAADLGDTLARLNKRETISLKSSTKQADKKDTRNGVLNSLHVRARGFEADEFHGMICERIWTCQACDRHTGRHLVNSGHYGARMMFVVAHPSENDLKFGRLMMFGEERDLFNNLLKAMGLSRLDIYLTSLLKCQDTLPTEEQWSHCHQHFRDELQLVQPEIIITLGYLASVILLGSGAHQGVWGDYQGVPVMPTAHPQDILSGGVSLKRSVWKHLREVMRRGGLKPT